MIGIAEGLARLYSLYLHVLLRLGVSARLSALPLPVPPDTRPLWALTLATSSVLLLYSALSAGSGSSVRAFRVFALLAGASLPLAAARLQGTPEERALGGLLLLGLLFAGLLHRGLARERRESAAALLIERARWGVEVLGLLLFVVAGVCLASSQPVPLRLAFWALFLLRLSVSDLLDPSRLASETGLTASAAADMRRAAGAARAKKRPTPLRRRFRLLVTGTLKGALLVCWIALPLAAALAPGEVAAGTWPAEAGLLQLYPPVALCLTALILLGDAWRSVPGRPIEAGRALAAGVATGLYLASAYRDPAFAAYREALPGVVLLEACFGFLLGAARRGR